MADSVLAGTLPEETGGSLVDFQKAMRMASTEAYDARAKEDQKLADKQFDPTKVSGGTFASIMDNLEQERGKDVSKIYASTVDAYKTQESEKAKARSKSGGTLTERLAAQKSDDFAGFDNFFDQYLEANVDISGEFPMTNEQYEGNIASALGSGKETFKGYIPADIYQEALGAFLRAYPGKESEFFDQYKGRLSPEDQKALMPRTAAQEASAETASEKDAVKEAEIETKLTQLVDHLEKFYAEEDTFGSEKRVSLTDIEEAVDKEDIPEIIKRLEEKGIIVEK